jgi:multidrug resistance protein, MATE family
MRSGYPTRRARYHAPVLAPSRRELGALVTIAMPLVLAQMAQNGMSLVDTIMAGRLGPEALAGIALGGVLASATNLAVGSTLLSVAPLCAHAVGAGREAEAARTTRHGVILALALAVPVMACLYAIGPLLPRLGQDPTIAAAATGYLRAVLWGSPAYLVIVALRGHLEGRGHTRPIMIVAFAGVALNVLANNAFMFGRWGFPALGLTGAGVATSLVYVAIAVALAVIVVRSTTAYPVFTREPFRAVVVRDLLRLGVPIGLTVAFETGLFAVTAVLMGAFGAAALAGHQIAIQTASFTFMIPLGLGIATTARVGQAAGRGDLRGVRDAASTGMALASVVMLLTAIVYWTAPRAVASLYLDVADPANADVIAMAVSFLRIAALFQVVDGLQVTVIGALRGLKDTRVPMIITLVSYWVVGIGMGVTLAFGAGLAGRGLWFGLLAGLGVAAIALLGRYASLVRARPEPADVR